MNQRRAIVKRSKEGRYSSVAVVVKYFAGFRLLTLFLLLPQAPTLSKPHPLTKLLHC